MSNPVTEVLDALSMTELERLCARREIKKHATKQPRIEALTRSYGDMFGQLLDDLTRATLAELLRSQQFELRGKILEFDNVSSLSKHHMQVAMHHVYVHAWAPTTFTKGPIDGLRLRVIDWGDDEQSDEVDEPASSVDASVSAPTWPVIESLTAHRADAWNASAQPPLQDFQQEAVERLVATFGQRRGTHAPRGILVLPTGGGKTRTSLQFLLDAYVSKGQRVLWVTHRRDLIDQVHGELRALAWLTKSIRSFTVSRLHGGARDPSGDIVLASSSTLARQQPARSVFEQQGKRLGIVCFDEAHHAVADSTWAALETIVGTEVPLLSLTATPYRMEVGGQAKLDRALGPVVYTKSFAELVKRGFLARPIFVQQTLESTKTLQGDDLSDEVVRAVARTPGRNEEIVRHWTRSAALFGKTIVFACDIDHAESLARRFAEKGYPTSIAHSQLDRDVRSRQIEAFRRGRGPSILVNVGLLTEGTNIPDTQTVLVARPTASTSLFHQMIGRGSRGEKVVPGKKVFHVIDCVDGLAAHGVHLAGRRVAAEFEIPVESRNGVREIKGADASPLATVASATAVVDPTIARQLTFGVTVAGAWLALSNRLPETIALTAAVAFGVDEEARVVPVFVESAPAVELALELLGAVLRGGRWSDVESKAQSLAEQGAVNDREWRGLVAFARANARMPTVIHDDFVRRDYTRERDLALVVAEHSRSAATMRDEAVLRAATEWLQARPDLAALFDSNRHYVAELDALSARPSDADRARLAASVPPPSPVADETPVAVVASSPAVSTEGVARTSDSGENDSPSAASPRVLDGFLRVCIALGLADNELSTAERTVIAKAIGDVLHLDAFVLDDATIDRVLASMSLDEACDALCDLLVWDQRSALLDWLIRIALADDRLHVNEIVTIQSIATDLGIPAEDCARRLGWHDDDSPAKARVVLGSIIVCPVCTSAMAMPAHFCGECGVSLVEAPTPSEAPSVRDVEPVATLPSCDQCGARSSMPARFCGACGAPFVDATSAVSNPSSVSRVVESDERAGQGPDFSTGHAAENWLFERLRDEFGERMVKRWDREGSGESDFRICVRDESTSAPRELHIEVKHSARVDPAQIYWSSGEIEKAREVLAKGFVYCLVILSKRSDEPETYDAYWFLDPLDELARCERHAQWQWRSEYIPVDSPAWNLVAPSIAREALRLDHCRVTVNVGAWPTGGDPIAPVLAWHRRSVR